MSTVPPGSMDLGFRCPLFQVCGGTRDKVFPFKRRRATHPSEGNNAGAGDREVDVAASAGLQQSPHQKNQHVAQCEVSLPQ